MSIGSVRSKIEAIERSIDAISHPPRSICKLKDGSITQIIGISVVQPFLDGDITEVCCDDADITRLLRALDTENRVKIELISLEEGDRLTREMIMSPDDVRLAQDGTQ